MLAMAGGLGVLAYVRLSQTVVRPLCIAEAVPESPTHVGSDWYWLERTPRAVHLVRVHDRRRQILASHDEIGGYVASLRGVAWSARAAGAWQVRACRADGSGVTTVWTGPSRIFAAWTDGATRAWLVDRPSVKTSAVHLPPMGRRVELWTDSEGRARCVAEMAEGLVSARILGTRNGAFLIAGVREDGIRSSVLYRAMPGQSPRRIAGEVGSIHAILAVDGRLYWTAPSRASNSLLTGCVRWADPDKAEPRTLADWVPSGGYLNETARGLILTGASGESAWLVPPGTAVGRPVPLVKTEWPVGAGDGEMITVLRVKTPGRVAVSTVGIR
jgi:hypothetical protein